MNSARTLVLFTGTYPCGKGETFIENEIAYLAETFNRVIIVTNNLNAPVTRTVPANVKVVRYAYHAKRLNKLTALLSWFNPTIKEEFAFIKNQLKLPVNKAVLSTLFASFAKAREMQQFISSLFKNENLKAGTTTLYSYWLNDMATGIAYYKSQHPAIKAICRAHRWDIYMAGHAGNYLPLRLFTLQHLDACYSISADGVSYLNTITQNRFTQKIKLARLGTLNAAGTLNTGNQHKTVLVSCSHVIARKRIHLIIEALASLNNTNVEWIHFGDGPLLTEIKQLAQTKLAPLDINYQLPGAISNKDLLHFYASSAVDLFVNVSDSEGVPVSIMEAFSFGIPAIATNVGGSAEIISHGSNGFLLPVSSPSQQIAAAVAQYVHLSAEEKRDMRTHAWQQWNNHYNADVNYRAFTTALT